MYIVLGLPEHSLLTNQFYNSAVLINPDGSIMGTYRKHSHLIESSWSSLGRGQVPVFETIYGKLAILICADISYPELSIQAMLQDALFLVLPTNGGINEDLLRARAIEGNCHIILANRYGNELNEYLDLKFSEHFTEETFQIIPPFYYDFLDGKSVIIDSNGQIDLLIDQPFDSIGYYELPIQNVKNVVIRRPELYTLLGQNTLDSYVLKCMKLPIPSSFPVAAASLKSKDSEEVIKDIQEILIKVQDCQNNPKACELIVFPADVLTLESIDADKLIASLKNLAKEANIDIVLGLRITENNYSSYAVSLLITKEGRNYSYKRLHKFEDENIQTGNHFFVIDRTYGRLALLQDKDLLIPEVTKVLAKMGVDLVAVSANINDDTIRTFSKVRSSDYLHIIMSNVESTGIYLGSFQVYPYFEEQGSITIMEINTSHVREKKELKIGYDSELILKQEK